MNSRFSNKQLKAEAQRLGFFACGIAKARPVDQQTATHYRQWIAAGGHADMHYLEQNMEKRLDPTLLVEGARSIITVAMNYTPARHIPAGEYQIAAYAYGKDYHDTVKARLRELCLALPASGASKPCVDTVPILERYWAQQAGIGFIGRNHQLIIPQAGSMFYLGEIVTDAEADQYDEPMVCLCGNCHRCIDACPTGALTLTGSAFLSGRCLSYQTIENRGPIDQSLTDKLGLSIYGCDRCQQACPWNRFAVPTPIPELQPSDELLLMRRHDWQQLTVDDYRRLFKGSAVKRAKYEGLMRNIGIVSSAEEKHTKTP